MKIIIIISLSFICSSFIISKPNLLSNKINSKYDELSPVISRDGSTLYFCREGSPLNVGYRYRKDDQDIWVSYFKNGQWTKAKHIDAAFNSYGYDFPIGTSSDGKTLYIGNTYYKDGHVGPGISKTKFINGKWTFPKKIEIEDFYSQSILVSYSISSNEKILILNIRREDTIGGMDLYVSFLKSNNKWSKPVNMGKQLNSKYNEITPYIANDLKTLYFSSNRPNGQGRFDMYISHRLDKSWQKWSKPINLGNTINTPNNDIGYIVMPDGITVVFSLIEKKSRKKRKNLYKNILPTLFRVK